MKLYREIDVLACIDSIITNWRYISDRYHDKYYVDEKTFRRMLGLSRTKFYDMKKAGKFELGMQSATRGTRRVKYHILFNYQTQKIEIEGQKRLPIEPKHRRNNNGKKAAKQQSPEQKSEQGFQEGSSGNANQ
ncbi:MAG: hypothetical protein LBC64_01820 [Fibromonadaceae bacterium]|jgi:hypothetical protein|nr:hypothetical protein [Fibromonadaceae bacterium]